MPADGAEDRRRAAQPRLDLRIRLPVGGAFEPQDELGDEFVRLHGALGVPRLVLSHEPTLSCALAGVAASPANRCLSTPIVGSPAGFGEPDHSAPRPFGVPSPVGPSYPLTAVHR